MRSAVAFIKKEITEQLRSGKLTFLGIIFVLFGIMNPAIAKMTPWLLEMMSTSLEGSGINVTNVKVTAMDSLVQFFKNIPMALIAFVLIESSIFTKEFTSGTLILSLTKGLERFKVVIAKSLVLVVTWTLGYWSCFAITYAYTVYFWDISVVKNLLFSTACQWIFGLFVISLTVLFSTAVRSSSGVLVGTGGIVLVSSFLSIIPKISKYLPTHLSDGNSLIYGTTEPKEYLVCIILTAIATIVCFGISIPIFNKKQL